MRNSEQTATFALYSTNRLDFITVVESVYSAVRTDSLYTADLHLVFKSLNKLKIQNVTEGKKLEKRNALVYIGSTYRWQQIRTASVLLLMKGNRKY